MDSTVGHIILHVGKLKAGDYWLLILDIYDPTLTKRKLSKYILLHICLYLGIVYIFFTAWYY